MFKNIHVRYISDSVSPKWYIVNNRNITVGEILKKNFNKKEHVVPKLMPHKYRPIHNSPLLLRSVGRDSVVGIVTRYGLDGPEIESRQGRDFQHPSRPALGPTQPPVQWVPGHYR
jgi:hypothetical protein